MDKSSVPLWAFLLTTLIAVVGPFASAIVVSRRAQKHETLMWFREKKHDAFEESVRLMQRGMSMVEDLKDGEVASPGNLRDRLDTAFAALAIYAPIEVYQLGESCYEQLTAALSRPRDDSTLPQLRTALGNFRMAIRVDVRRRATKAPY